MNRLQVIEAVASVPYWRHKIDLPFGVITPGRVGRELIDRLGLPSNLCGKSVLDIGTFDGLCAFEAEARGADRVLAIDTWQGKGSDDPEWWRELHTGGAGFRIAKEILNSKVLAKELSVYEIEENLLGKFDYVLMCGLVYHLRDPLKAIEKALSVTNEVLLIESMVICLNNCDLPIMLFCRGSNESFSLNRWWEFSPQALIAACRAVEAKETVVESIIWFTPRRQFINVSGPICLFSTPAINSQIVGVFEQKKELEVSSNRYTFRDNYYWLRVSIIDRTNSDRSFGWIRLDPDSELPVIHEEQIESSKTHGRIVLKVTP